MQLEGVNFSPWMPSGDVRFKGLRLLLLGESQYNDSGEENFGLEDPTQSTIWVIKEYGIKAERRTRFHVNVYTMLTGLQWISGSESVRDFWNSVFFYNYVQEFVGPNYGYRPKLGMFRRSSLGFRSVLTTINPDAILVLGEAVWQQMDDTGASLLAEDNLALAPVYRYNTGLGVALAAHTPHPSSPGFSAIGWHNQVSDFLSHARNMKT